jgi:exoribonuclease R
MVAYKIFIDKLGNHTFVDNDSFQSANLDNSIVPTKLFPEDVFTYDASTNKPATIVHSIVRNMKNIPGVLIIDDFNTYGKRKGKSLYKCIPDDTRLPTFLVPYEMKHLGFCKDIPNLYVTIQFADWEDKHPIGTLSQNIGSVNVLEHFYEYQLYCKSLNHSIQKFNKAVEKKLKESDSHALIDDAFAIIKGRVEDRTTNGYYVFTIDPPGCTDFDDGFSIVKNEADGSAIISIYISNVPILLESLNLWSTFSQRVSTIYLPDKKRPMLPTILSDGLCSLQAKQSRIAYVIDVKVSKTGIIESVDYLSCKIRVARNFEYEERALTDNESYKLLFSTVNSLSGNYKYLNNVQNSHDVVAYLMILMNNQCAKRLSQLNMGVFRVTQDNRPPVVKSHQTLTEVNKFIEIWRSVCGQYVDLSKLNAHDNLTHSVLNLEEYVHITSPIRRIVDLLNMIMIQCDTPFGKDALKFVGDWLEQLDYINTTMRSIRKVQTDCDFLSLCMIDDTALTREYDGHCFDRICRSDGLFQYNVFIPFLKMAYRITTRELMEDLELRKYKLYLFANENKYKRKIRLQIVG